MIRRIGFYRLENAVRMCLNQIIGNVTSNVSEKCNAAPRQVLPA